MATLDELRAQLRTADRDRYLASLLLPARVQRDAAALFLFNAEIASIRDRISEAMAGEIRLQWWREVVTGTRRSEAAGHPVAGALIEAIDTHALPVAALEAMCEAREFDLYDDPMPDRTGYELYAGRTASALMQLTALMIDPKAAEGAADAAGHAGVAQAVSGHLMLLPVHTGRGQIYMPGDLLAAVGLDRESFLARAEDDDRRAAAVSAFVAFGREHLEKARAAIAGADARLAPAWLPAAIAEGVFRRAERFGRAGFDRSVQPGLLARQWAIWRAARRGTI